VARQTKATRVAAMVLLMLMLMLMLMLLGAAIGRLPNQIRIQTRRVKASRRTTTMMMTIQRRCTRDQSLRMECELEVSTNKNPKVNFDLRVWDRET
jgi:predicted Holliday junction resolvase-like endonuclease